MGPGEGVRKVYAYCPIILLAVVGRNGGAMAASDAAPFPGKELLSLPQANTNKPITPRESRINLQAKGLH